MIDQRLAVYENGYPVTFSHIDNRGIARPSALFEMMQDAATAHAETLHLSPQDLGAFWVLSRLHCTVSRPIYPHEIIDVQTWCAGIKGATWLRAFALSIAGQQIGQAISTWVVLDWADHHIIRPNRIPAAQDYMEFAKKECPPIPGKLVCGQTAPHHVHTVRYSDLDVNGHMNNVKIVDVVCDGLELDRQGNQFISEIQVNYTSECMPGEEILISTGNAADGCRYLFGQAGGQPRFEAMAKLSAWAKKEED